MVKSDRYILPRIIHHRGKLSWHLIRHHDGGFWIRMWCDTYPELFERRFPEVVRSAQKGWYPWERNDSQVCLWFAEGTLDDGAIDEIEAWCERFGNYVLLGLKDETLGEYFDEELDFCMALSFNYNLEEGERTELGEAEYKLKYRKGDLSAREKKRYISLIMKGVKQGFKDLPLPPGEEILISTIPATNSKKKKLAWKLAKWLAKNRECEFLAATLNIKKPAMKELSLMKKVEKWRRINGTQDAIDLSCRVADKTIVVVDDLYQSGASMWCYAEYLKELGARHVVGLACVKSLRDTDNQ